MNRDWSIPRMIGSTTAYLLNASKLTHQLRYTPESVSATESPLSCTWRASKALSNPCFSSASRSNRCTISVTADLNRPCCSSSLSSGRESKVFPKFRLWSLLWKTGGAWVKREGAPAAGNKGDE